MVMRKLGKPPAFVLALSVGMPAGAAGVITATPNPIPVSAAQTAANVTVNWSGMPALQPVYVTQCFKSISDPTCDPFASCSNLSEIVINQSSNANGSGSLPSGAYGPFSVFRGE